MKLSWKLKVYRTWEEVDDPLFLAKWEKWLDDAPDAHVFIHPVLVKTWTDNYRSLQDIAPFYCVAQAGEVTVFLPLVVWRRNWKNAFLRFLVPAGYSDYDYHDPIFVGQHSKETIQSFWQMMHEHYFGNKEFQYDQVVLSGIRVPGSNNQWTQEDDVCPYKDLTQYESFDHFFSALRKNMRHGIRRQIRLLDELGGLTFHCYNPEEIDKVVTVLPDFLKTHANRWPNAYKAPGLHEAILRNGISSGIVHFSELRIDSKPISWELGFCYKKKRYTYIGSFIEQFSKYSPGKIHLLYLFEDAINNDIEIFDHLRGAHAYKDVWSDDSIALYDYHQEAMRVSSRIRLVARDILQRFYQNILFMPILFCCFDQVFYVMINY